MLVGTGITYAWPILCTYSPSTAAKVLDPVPNNSFAALVSVSERRRRPGRRRGDEQIVRDHAHLSLVPVYVVGVEEWQQRNTQDILQLDQNVQRWPGSVLERVAKGVADDAGFMSL